MSENTADGCCRVLVVDDDPALRGLLTLGLAGAGHEIAEAGSREAAIEQLKAFEPDVMVLDMGMPPHEHDLIEGLAVLRWLEEHPRLMKVIVLTGQDQDRSAFESIRLGAFDYLSKPVDMAVLLSAVERCRLFLENERRMRVQAGQQRVSVRVPLGQGVKPVRNLAEERLLRQVLEETGFNVHESARRLNMNRENIYYLLKKYGIRRPE